MKTRLLRNGAVLLLSAVLCGSALSLAGCGNKISHNPNTSEAYAPIVPDSKIDEDAPGKQYDTVIGTPLDYEGKLSVTLDRVVELDDAATTSNRVLLAELTIVNHTDKEIDCSTLTHFSAYVDDEKAGGVVSDIRAGIAARKYYTQTQSSLQSFNQAIQPGETLVGYAAMYLPTAWKSLTLCYTPYKYYSNDNLNFLIDESKLVHYTDALR